MKSWNADDPRAPLYRKLAEDLIGKIENGLVGDKQPIPSERELATSFHVSRDTVRKAIHYLEQRGILYSEHGRGTFVVPAMYRRMSRALNNFSQDVAMRGDTPGQRILSVEPAVASMAIAGVLGIEPGGTLIRVKRVRTVNDKPIGLHDAYLSLPYGTGIERNELERKGSLYELLKGKFGIIPAEAAENLSASLADENDATLLDVKPGSPLLICERITLSDRREPIEYCLMKYIHTYRYSTRIGKHGMAT